MSAFETFWVGEFKVAVTQLFHTVLEKKKLFRLKHLNGRYSIKCFYSGNEDS